MAHEWGLKPSAFWRSSRQDQAMMSAYCQDMSKMEAWEQEETERQMERERAKSSR